MPDISHLLHSQLDTAAEIHGDRTAVCDRRSSLTYSEFADLTNQVASYLVTSGVRRGDRVALLFDQSIDAIVAEYAVLRAGGAFVPLDIRDPQKRIAHILDDCSPALLITDKWHYERALVSAGHKLKVLRFQDLHSANTVALPAVEETDPAYIIYTSGSTGVPKGVTQTHKNVSYFVRKYSDTLSIGTGDNVSLLYSLNFSASVHDIFACFLNGATLKRFNLKEHGLSGLRNWIAKENITVLHTVPSVFRYLLKTSTDDNKYASLRVVDLGGEPIYKSDVDLFKKYFPDGCQIYNHLAATEISVISQKLIDPKKPHTEPLVAAGGSDNETKILILSPEGAVLPEGEKGQIAIANDHLSPGYHNNNMLNEQKYILNEHGRLFLSGDYGYLDLDGDLYITGRTDTRVKISGISIDTEEVEAGLNACSGIENAVVKVIDEPVTASLVAFIKTVGPDANESRLRHDLLDTLPDYMVPKYCVFIDEFPRTTTGKINRESLVFNNDAPDMNDRRDDSVQADVSSMFSRLLDITITDLEQTFFDLGGNSLDIIRLVSEIEARYEIRLPMRLVTRNSSVRSIVDFIQSSRKRAEYGGEESIIELLSDNDEKQYNLFLVHGLNGQVFTRDNFIRKLSNNFNVYGIRARGLSPGESPGVNMAGIASDYIVAIKNIQATGTYFLAGICVGSIIAAEMANQLHRTLETVAPVLAIDPPVRPAKQRMPKHKFKKELQNLYRKFHSPTAEELEDMAFRLTDRINAGTVNLESVDDSIVASSMKVATGLDIALFTYRPLPFPGEILVLASRYRLDMKKKYGDRLLHGRIRHFCIADDHFSVHTQENDLLLDTLTRCSNYCVKRAGVPA